MLSPSAIDGHHAVLDAVVHHLDEVTGAVRAAVQVALRGRVAGAGAAGRRAEPSVAGRDRSKIGSRRVDDVVLAADHQAVAALETPDPAARAAVHVVHAAFARARLARAMSSR